MVDAREPIVTQEDPFGTTVTQDGPPKERGVAQAIVDKRAREAKLAAQRLHERKLRATAEHDHNICVRECGMVLAYLRDQGFLQSGNFTAAYSHCADGKHRDHKH